MRIADVTDIPTVEALAATPAAFSLEVLMAAFAHARRIGGTAGLALKDAVVAACAATDTRPHMRTA